MWHGWSFQRRVTSGFTIVVVLAVAIGLLAIVALREVVEAYDDLLAVHVENEVQALQMKARAERQAAAIRGYLISGDPEFLARYEQAGDRFRIAADRLGAGVQDPDSAEALTRVQNIRARRDAVVDQVFGLVQEGAGAEVVEEVFARDLLPLSDQLNEAINALVELEDAHLDAEQIEAETAARNASAIVLVLGLLSVLLAMVVGYALVTSLRQQIAAATHHIQSSSAELQTAANQQATSAREQATAMHEIGTTIRELLSTSRQIAESARQVANIAGETEEAARNGERAMGESQRSADEIRQQVEQVVDHMLDLGRKSQQIGGILDLVNELTEQTNIVAINATIEAAGAGESGRRFAVVADEIRRLADRLGSSTKEIRSLIEEVRAAVNTTVMATETGAKAVDANSRKFEEVTITFGRIVDLVGTTTEAAREIELSTKQQSTAVEQVNLAVANVAQATRETEASSVQTTQTAAQLTNLSRALGRITGAVQG